MGIRERLKATLGRDPTYQEIQDAKHKKRELRTELVAKSNDQVDWTCLQCSAVCFGSKDSCFKCGTPKGSTTPESKKYRRREGAYKPREDIKCQDKTLVCKTCQQEFTFTAGEQEYFLRKGFIGVERSRCAPCAKSKKRKLDESDGTSSTAKPTCGGRLICFAWQNGACTRGDSCKFAHGEPDGMLGDSGGSGGSVTSAEAAAIKCFHCGQEGHRVSDCPKAKAQREAAAAKAAKSPKKKKKRNRNGTLPTANKPADS